ncbi:MAG: CDP-alcohol phosphatidyltransferase family protein [Rhodospirillales bacterium]|nr:CDP-alcohol phosphatidyltransferase family protein [Rhodospirillales bacterium]
MREAPYDQRLARHLIRPLAAVRVHPNAVTAMSLFLALAAAWLYATGDEAAANWAGGLFVLARFLDHVDGELARLTGKTSKFGYYFDYLTGALSFGALFLGIGIGLSAGWLEGWSIALGAAAAALAVVSAVLNVTQDRLKHLAEGEAVGYPAYGGFELEDGIYLIAPITWLGLIMPFFLAATVGAIVYTLWTARETLRAQGPKEGRQGPSA